MTKINLRITRMITAVLTVVSAAAMSMAVYASAPADQTDYRRAADAYFELLGNVQQDINRITDLFEGESEQPGRIIIRDIVGDSIPEIIYSTIEDETGSCVLTMRDSLEYTHKIVTHIAGYDCAAGQIVSLLDFDAICFDEEGAYTHFGIWPAGYYTADDNGKIYYRTPVSWSGQAVQIYEYSYDESSGNLNQTGEILIGPGDAAESDITVPEMRDIFQQNENTMLLTDAYGNSDYTAMPFQDALQALRQLENGSPDSSMFRTDGDEKQPVLETSAEDKQLVVPEDLDPYKQAYITILQGFRRNIEEYAAFAADAKETDIPGCVCVCDIYGDEIPELIFMAQSQENPQEAQFYILTYRDDRAELIYSDVWDHFTDSDRTEICLFRANEAKTLYVYKNRISTVSDQTYSYFNTDNGIEVQLLLEKAVPADPDESADSAQCYRYGSAISEWDYDIAVKNIMDNTVDILICNYSRDDLENAFSGDKEIAAMSCTQALEYLIR